MYFVFLTILSSFIVYSAPTIIKGENASLRDFPWQVSIQNRDGHICGGSIISKRHILTAAHCLTRKEIEVYGGGDGNIWRVDKLGKIKNITSHDNWIRTRKLNDIGVIEFEEDIVFSETIQPIRFISNFTITKSVKAILTGFGVVIDPNINREIKFPNELQKVELELAANFSDSKFWPKVLGTYYSEKYDEYGASAFADIPNRVFSDRKGGCYADSGGPLVIKNKNEYIQIGIVSKLIDGCGVATVFTDVSNHYQWIQATLAQ